jgi:hypothetical protein
MFASSLEIVPPDSVIVWICPAQIFGASIIDKRNLLDIGLDWFLFDFLPARRAITALNIFRLCDWATTAVTEVAMNSDEFSTYHSIIISRR